MLCVSDVGCILPLLPGHMMNKEAFLKKTICEKTITGLESVSQDRSASSQALLILDEILHETFID